MLQPPSQPKGGNVVVYHRVDLGGTAPAAPLTPDFRHRANPTTHSAARKTKNST